MIRPATNSDIPAILAFWNPLIRDSVIAFSSEEKTKESLADMITRRRADGYEFLVADEGGVTGFVTYDQFRAGNGYVHAMEHTIVLAPQAQRAGTGRMLMTAIEEHARTGGAHIMVGGISAENDAGLKFHHAVGYTDAGTVRQAGRKFGRWIDLCLVQKIL